MERQLDIPTELYEDEVVSFLADRYHSTPDEIVRCFLAQDGRIQDGRKTSCFVLEENEMEIMRGLAKGVLCRRKYDI